MECLWGHSKLRIMKLMKGTSLKNLPGHLAEQWFRSTVTKDGPSVFKSLIHILKSFKEF